MSLFAFRTRPLLRLLPLGALLLLVSGCAMMLSPPKHRANQYARHFATYPEPVQARLRVATIAPGDDRTAVYIALGRPQNTRIGYDREASTGKGIAIEYWEYSGYPIDDVEGRFMTLNNGGFASPLGLNPYGKVTVEFADSLVRSFRYDPDEEVATANSDRNMAVPANPHSD